MPTSNGFVYLAIALLALFSLSLIHEHHRNGDARLEAVSRLTALGIPRHHISAGFEFDGETQLLEWGYLNHPRLKSPPNAFLPVRRDPAWPLEFFWFLPHTPAIQPEYIISRSSVPLYADAGLGNVTYRFFLPPFRRTLSILRLEDPAQRPLILLGPPPPGKTVRSNKPITTER